MHLVFYDGECGLCDHVVQWLLKEDQQQQFLFAPLKGVTAAKKLQNVPERVKTADSIILIENYQQPDEMTYVYGKAALRICWLLGGAWAIPGVLSFIPAFLYDWMYWIVARIRYRLFGKKLVCPLPDTHIDKSRFLP
jgi:predicted DCC family thiol-disulfide oxidoreductase YuxK